MGQPLSRPVRWASAIERANNAKWELQSLRDQLIETYEKFEDQWTNERKNFDTALGDLVHLQHDYASSTVLADPNTAERQDYVTGLNFEKMLDKIPDLGKIIEPLKKFNPSETSDFDTLDDAQVTPPKWYGRDK